MYGNKAPITALNGRARKISAAWTVARARAKCGVKGQVNRIYGHKRSLGIKYGRGPFTALHTNILPLPDGRLTRTCLRHVLVCRRHTHLKMIYTVWEVFGSWLVVGMDTNMQSCSTCFLYYWDRVCTHVSGLVRMVSLCTTVVQMSTLAPGW